MQSSLRARLSLITIATVMVLLSPPAYAQLNQGVEGMAPSALFPGAEFDPDIPSPKEFLGSDPGARPYRPEEILDYFQALVDASVNARILEYARSHEDRPLVLLAVSDPQTITGLQEFRTRHAQVMDPRNDIAPGPEDKAVAWMAYGIHGDELSSPDAAVAVAYRLVAGTDDEARRMRDELVILVDPCENPDGRARYLAQITSFAHRTANPDLEDLSHTAVWPWGRGNHYLFDLNRDWISMAQPESRRTQEIATWLPQLLVDSHEMGSNSTYLFPPPRHPFNPFLPPNARKWETRISDDQARALDGRGYPYFTGEWNEEFFPGYGSSWCMYHGTVGILYEMSRTGGTLVRKREGTVRTFAQAVDHQTTSSMANLRSLTANRADMLADQIAARNSAVEKGKNGTVKGYVFPRDEPRGGLVDKLADLLTRQGIEVLALEGERSAKGTDIRTGRKTDLDLTSGALLVRLDQPAGYMVRALCDPHVPMDATFFAEEREYLEKGKGSRLYETTAWSLPLAFGVQGYWTGSIPGGDWQPWTLPPAAPKSKVPATFSTLVLKVEDPAAPALLSQWLQSGITVRVARKPFTIGDQSFAAGALLIRAEGNPSDVVARLQKAADLHGGTYYPVTTSRAQDGPDLGGRHYPALVEPRVGVLTGMPVSATSYGAVWHLLDQELDLRFSGLDIGRFSGIDLSRYNVLVFPSVYGGAPVYRHLLGESGIEKLKQWIKAGGTAVGVAGGARFLADPELELTRTRFRQHALETFPSPVWSLPAAIAAEAGPVQAAGLRVEPSPKPEDGDKPKDPDFAADRSPYDVAPLLGPGALPFVGGFDQGTPLETKIETLGDWTKPVLPPGQSQATPEDLARADRRLRRFMPQGAFLRTYLDTEHWLNAGLGSEMTVWFGGNDSLVGPDGGQVAAWFGDPDDLHLGGLLWPEAAARLARTGYCVREGVGRGQVIVFAEQPVYRRWMKESERMFMNAVLMGPGLGARYSAPW